MGRRSKFEIDVQIMPAFAELVVEQRLRQVAQAAMSGEVASGQATLVITDDQGIQVLNRDYLGRDAPTDVLAFSAREDGGSFVTAEEMAGYLGDVIISYPRAVAQAEEQGHPVEQEIDLLVAHGLLHLLGYDHSDEEEKAIMWARQDAVLARAQGGAL